MCIEEERRWKIKKLIDLPIRKINFNFSSLSSEDTHNPPPIKTTQVRSVGVGTNNEMRIKTVLSIFFAVRWHGRNVKGSNTNI